MPLTYDKKIENSSNIEGIAYDGATKVLTVKFLSGSIYTYADVPEDVAQAFDEADSKGRYFHRNIRPAGYTYTKVAG